MISGPVRIMGRVRLIKFTDVTGRPGKTRIRTGVIGKLSARFPEGELTDQHARIDHDRLYASELQGPAMGVADVAEIGRELHEQAETANRDRKSTRLNP